MINDSIVTKGMLSYFKDKMNDGATSLVVKTQSTPGQPITATVANADNGLRFDVAGDAIQMDFTNENLTNTKFLATTGYVDTKLDADGSNADASNFSIESNNVVISGGTEGSVSITELVDPTESHHAANKKYVDETIAVELDAFEHQDYKIVDTLPATGEAGVRYLLKIVDNPGPPEEFHMEEYMYIENKWRDCGRFDTIKEATDTVAGTVKLNPSESITLSENGQLKVGGRIGQFSGTTGLFAPTDRAPRRVNDYSFLVTDAKGVDMNANRALAIVSGYGLACQSAPAGSKTYKISNTYVNRIIAKMAEGGYAAKDEATSTVSQIIPVTSVKINGSTFTPSSVANNSGQPIEITVAETLNPDTAITNIRLFGSMQSYATAHIGNGVKTESGGRSLMIGGGISKVGSGNDICIVGNAMYSSGNGNALFGRNHISTKNRWFMAGDGHDNTNGISEAGAVLGKYADIKNDTAFAVGNGTSHTQRSNLFEIKTNGDMYINGIKVNIT